MNGPMRLGRLRRLVATTTALAALFVGAVSAPVGAPDASDPASGNGLAASLPSRLGATNAVEVGVAASKQRFGNGGARHVTLTRNDNWPDALASAPLTAEGPLLFTSPAALNSTTMAELRRVLPAGSTVYLVGGEAAISSQIAAQLAQSGYAVRRLSGPDRVSTSVAIADEVVRLYGHEDQLVVARSRGAAGNETAGWADSVSGSAYAARNRLPVVVTPSDGLDAAVASYIRRHGPTTTWVLGGESAVSSAVAGKVPNPQRIFGASRAGTAAAIATRLWPYPSAGGYLLVNGTRPDGWAFGLAAAGLGADNGAPILLVDDTLPEPTKEVIGTCNSGQSATTVVGSTSQVSNAVAQAARDAAAGACTRLVSGFNYMAINDDGSPVRYNPCATMAFQVNLAGAPPNAYTLLQGALDKMSAATGVAYTLGLTDERMDSQTSQRSYVQGGAYKPVLVNWPVSWGTDPAYGYGGSAAIRLSNGKRQYVSGIVNMNAATPANDGTLDHVLTHEIAHVIGLSHVEDEAQLMYPFAQPDVTQYQSGDRAGLETLGTAAGCMGSTVAYAQAGQQPSQVWPSDEGEQ